MNPAAPLAPEEALPTGSAKTQMVRQMFDTIAPRYDLVNRVMTLGLDQGWRRRTVAALELAPTSLVLDLACGTGDLVALLRASGYRPIGADLSFGMLASARPETRGLVLEADGATLPLAAGALDGIVSGFALRNFSNLATIFAEAARVVRPGGRVSFLDVDAPALPLLRHGHQWWFTKVVPRIGAVFSDPTAYRYLPRSVAYLPPAPEMRALFEQAGFDQVVQHRLSAGIVQLWSATRARHQARATHRLGNGAPAVDR